MFCCWWYELSFDETQILFDKAVVSVKSDVVAVSCKLEDGVSAWLLSLASFEELPVLELMSVIEDMPKLLTRGEMLSDWLKSSKGLIPLGRVPQGGWERVRP